MERIKLALEKARQERERGGNPGESPGIVERLAAASVPAAVHRGGAEVTYTRTRSLPVSTQVLRDHHIVSGVGPGAFTDAYKILRTQVLQRLRENHWNALAVTSPNPHEGKTLTAVNLAISLALEVEHTVLLIDADLRRPHVHDYFGLSIEHGLSDYLTGSLSLEELLINPASIGGFVLLPGGTPLIHSAEMLNSPKMAHLVEELKSRYPARILVFDLPALLNTADALAFAPYVDAALLVVEDGKTSRDDLTRAVDLLQGTNLIGTVLNKAPGRTERRGGGWLTRLGGGGH